MKHQILVEFESKQSPEEARLAVKNLLDDGLLKPTPVLPLRTTVQIISRKAKAPQVEASLRDGNLYLYSHGTNAELELEGSPQEIVDAVQRIAETARQNPTKIQAGQLPIGKICTFNNSIYRRIQFGRSINAAVHPYSEDDFIFVLNEDSNTVIALPSDTQVEPL